MKILNLCSGANRIQSDEWINLDNLFPVLPEGSPERNNLLAEKNYVEFDVLSGPLPFREGAFDSVLASHCAEHWDCQQATAVMAECRRILKPGGILLVSVPDADLFRNLYDTDDGLNAEELFGEPIYAGDGEKTFTNYCLWNRWHKAILDETALWHYFKRAGFANPDRLIFDHGRMVYPAIVTASPLDHLVPVLNRLVFSLCMMGVKE